MSYVRQDFVNGEVLPAEKLIKMEDGILERIKAPAAAAIGQTIRVSAVDDAGQPTEWEAVDVYDKTQIDTALGNYITDVAALVGGDA